MKIGVKSGYISQLVKPNQHVLFGVRSKLTLLGIPASTSWNSSDWLSDSLQWAMFQVIFVVRASPETRQNHTRSTTHMLSIVLCEFFRTLKWRYCILRPYFVGIIPLHRPWPLNSLLNLWRFIQRYGSRTCFCSQFPQPSAHENYIFSYRLLVTSLESSNPQGWAFQVPRCKQLASFGHVLLGRLRFLMFRDGTVLLSHGSSWIWDLVGSLKSWKTSESDWWILFSLELFGLWYHIISLS